MFQRSVCSEGSCSESSMFRRSYVQKLLYSEAHMFRMSLKKEKQHKKRQKARHDEQKTNSSCTRKGDCMRNSGLRKSRRSASRSLGHRKISGTRHGTNTQCKKGRGANHSAWHSVIYNARRSTINYNFIAEVWSDIFVRKT